MSPAKWIVKRAALPLVMVILACASPTGPEQQSLETGTSRLVLAPNESRVISGTTRVGLDRVISDSRCPVDVMCAWAGEVTVALWIEDSGSRTDLQLASLTNPERRAGRFLIRIVEVAPPPARAAEKIDPAAYRITLEVSAVQS